jgi:ribonuclease HII
LPAWLRDSKLLAEERRERVFSDVAAWCVDGAVGHASAGECDALGMTAALRLAAVRALSELEMPPEALLIDGPYDLVRPWPDGVRTPRSVVPVVDGDARCAAVAAASILAKVSRDRIMREEARHFPYYHFERNKGYPSTAHKIALRGYGVSAIHRRSWAFVDELPWGNPTDSYTG